MLRRSWKQGRKRSEYGWCRETGRNVTQEKDNGSYGQGINNRSAGNCQILRILWTGYSQNAWEGGPKLWTNWRSGAWTAERPTTQCSQDDFECGRQKMWRGRRDDDSEKKKLGLGQEGMKCLLRNRVSVSGKHTATESPTDGLNIQRRESKELQIPGRWSELSSPHSKCHTI